MIRGHHRDWRRRRCARSWRRASTSSRSTTTETIDDALKLIVERGFSRIPLYDETIDNIVGIIYAKDLLRCLTEGRRPALTEIARPPYFIPESKRVDELLAELRQSKVHIAIVVDEYGGTAGLVTIEDLLEEIVGEIQDEYDREEAPIERVSETEAILDARVSIDALNELFGFEPDEDDQDYDTRRRLRLPPPRQGARRRRRGARRRPDAARAQRPRPPHQEGARDAA